MLYKATQADIQNLFKVPDPKQGKRKITVASNYGISIETEYDPNDENLYGGSDSNLGGTGWLCLGSIEGYNRLEIQAIGARVVVGSDNNLYLTNPYGEVKVDLDSWNPK